MQTIHSSNKFRTHPIVKTSPRSCLRPGVISSGLRILGSYTFCCRKWLPAASLCLPVAAGGVLLWFCAFLLKEMASCRKFMLSCCIGRLPAGSLCLPAAIFRLPVVTVTFPAAGLSFPAGQERAKLRQDGSQRGRKPKALAGHYKSVIYVLSVVLLLLFFTFR